jgi:predicted Zn-dependent peptidase
MLSDFFSGLELPIYRADTLAIRQLFTGDAETINDVPAQIEAVTVDDIKRFAATYLTVPNRAWIDRRPGDSPPAPPASEGGMS